MPINVGRKHVNKRKLMRGDMLVWMIEFATKNLSLRQKMSANIRVTGKTSA